MGLKLLENIPLKLLREIVNFQRYEWLDTYGREAEPHPLLNLLNDPFSGKNIRALLLCNLNNHITLFKLIPFSFWQIFDSPPIPGTVTCFTLELLKQWIVKKVKNKQWWHRIFSSIAFSLHQALWQAQSILYKIIQMLAQKCFSLIQVGWKTLRLTF